MDSMGNKDVAAESQHEQKETDDMSISSEVVEKQDTPKEKQKDGVECLIDVMLESYKKSLHEKVRSSVLQEAREQNRQKEAQYERIIAQLREEVTSYEVSTREFQVKIEELQKSIDSLASQNGAVFEELKIVKGTLGQKEEDIEGLQALIKDLQATNADALKEEIEKWKECTQELEQRVVSFREENAKLQAEIDEFKGAQTDTQALAALEEELKMVSDKYHQAKLELEKVRLLMQSLEEQNSALAAENKSLKEATTQSNQAALREEEIIAEVESLRKELEKEKELSIALKKDCNQARGELSDAKAQYETLQQEIRVLLVAREEEKAAIRHALDEHNKYKHAAEQRVQQLERQKSLLENEVSLLKGEDS